MSNGFRAVWRYGVCNKSNNPNYQTTTTTNISSACIDLTLPTCHSSIEHIKSHLAKASPTLPTLDIRSYACDVTSESAVRATFAQIAADFGRIDVLVSAAGIVDNVKAEAYEFERWRKMMEVNLDGSWLVAREGGRYKIGRAHV